MTVVTGLRFYAGPRIPDGVASLQRFLPIPCADLARLLEITCSLPSFVLWLRLWLLVFSVCVSPPRRCATCEDGCGGRVVGGGGDVGVFWRSLRWHSVPEARAPIDSLDVTHTSRATAHAVNARAPVWVRVCARADEEGKCAAEL